MGDRRSGLWGLLETPWVHRAAQDAVGARRLRATLAARYIVPTPGLRVLDLGCGIGEMFDALGETAYLGIDINPRYIEAARRRCGGRARFEHGDVGKLAARDDLQLDVVIAAGLLHHLDDDEVAACLASVTPRLVPGGRLVAIDPAREGRSNPISRWLIDRDRGRHIRWAADYARLAEPWFEEAEVHVESGLLRLPYTHAVTVARRPRQAPG